MKHSKLGAVVALALLFAGLAAGCAPFGRAPDANEGNTMDLNGTAWTLVELPGLDLLPDPKATLNFGDGQVQGSAGCNHYFGTYEAEGERLAVGEIGATEMYCSAPEGLMEQEQAYLKALGQAAGYRLEGDRLAVLRAGGERLLEFVAVTE